MKKVSIIIPCYNGSKTLHRCLDSVVSQTYKNLEVLVINDGSKDNSAEIIFEYAKKYPFIQLISKENGGQSTARNLGLELCTGDYVMFLDCDDNYTKKYAIEKMVRTLEQKNVDVVVCNFTHPVFESFARGGMYDMTDPKQRDEYFEDFFVFGMPWNKVYRREILTEQYVKGLGFTEDELFNEAIFPNIKKAYVIKEVLHNYYCAPKTEKEKSAVNAVATNKDLDSTRNGFFFKLLDLYPIRDQVILKKYDIETADKMKATRLILFAIYDVIFMKYLGLPVAYQKHSMSYVATSPEFKQMLILKSGAYGNLDTTREEDLLESMNNFVEKANEMKIAPFQNRYNTLFNLFKQTFYRPADDCCLEEVLDAYPVKV